MITVRSWFAIFAAIAYRCELPSDVRDAFLAEENAFAALIAAGAVRESGKTYAVRECRAGETEE